MSTSARNPDAQLPLWPDGVPGGVIAESKDTLPRLLVFKADRPNAPCVLVCPGGGYSNRAAHEADPIAHWLNTLGITGIVVHYRVAPYRHPQPLNDLSQAMRLTRQHAAEWGIDASKIGVLGFSAGGHLASTLCTISDEDVRPDIAILLYPVISFGDASAHTGSRRNLVPDAEDKSWIDKLSSELHVTAKTAPTFIFHTVDDPAVPVENALLYAASLRRHGVPFEMHLYERGRHGVGLAKDIPELATWPLMCGNWLRLRGWAL